MAMSSAAIRIVLTGYRETLAGLGAVKHEVTSLSARLAAFGEVEREVTKRSWLMNQALFTMRRYAYMGTLAVTGTTAAFLTWGTEFNATMQSATIALLPVMKNSGDVRVELQKLYNMAKYNPFRFQDMTTAFRSMFLAMQPLGITADDVNQTLHSMVDALSATGRTSPSQLNRVAVALQHMAYQGRLTGFTVNQLARDGIPIYGTLSKEMGITGAQLHNISKLGIPTSEVMKALNRYIESTPGLMNAAARQSRTLGGELATLKDNISQTMGALTIGAFTGATRQGGLLPSINRMFNGISKIILRQKGKIGLGQVFGVIGNQWPWAKPLIAILEEIVKVVRILWNVIRNGLLPSLGILGLILVTVVFPAMKPVLWALTQLSKHSWLLVPVIMVLLGLWTAEKTVLLTVAAAERIAATWAFFYNIVTGKSVGVLKAKVIWTRLATRAQIIWTGVTRLATRAQILWSIATGTAARASNGQFRALTRVERISRRLIVTTRALTAAMWAFVIDNPIGIIIAAVVLLTVGIVILYFKWKWFHNLVNNTMGWIWKHWKMVAAILLFISPIFAILLVAARLLADHWRDLWNILNKSWSALVSASKYLSGIFQGVYHWLVRMYNKLKDFLGLWTKIPGLKFLVDTAKSAAHAITRPGTGTFGFAQNASPSLGGPLLSPQSQINPLLASAGNANKSPFNLTVHNHISLDGKQVAASTAKHRQKAAARK
jgi:tape measure domain-containing protein